MQVVIVDHGLFDESAGCCCIFVIRLFVLRNEIAVLSVAREPGEAEGCRNQSHQREGGPLQNQRASDRCLIGGDPIRLPNDDFRDQISQKKTLSRSRISRCGDLFCTETSGERADQLVDRCTLLSARTKIKAAQRRVDVIPGRLEYLVQETGNNRLQPRHLCRKPEQGDPITGRWFFLQAIDRLFAEPFEQLIELVRNLADQVLLLGRGLEGRPPDLPTTRLIEIAEIFGETGDQVSFREKGIDGKVDLQSLMQIKQTGADRVGVCVISAADSVRRSSTLIATITPLMG